jgi:hypothetical protein
MGWLEGRNNAVQDHNMTASYNPHTLPFPFRSHCHINQPPPISHNPATINKATERPIVSFSSYPFLFPSVNQAAGNSFPFILSYFLQRKEGDFLMLRKRKRQKSEPLVISKQFSTLPVWHITCVKLSAKRFKEEYNVSESINHTRARFRPDA